MSIESSSNGLTEFSSGVLGADFKGSFCLATIGFDAIGSSFSLTLNAAGTNVVQREEIFTDNGGLDMVMDRYASLIVTEVSCKLMTLSWINKTDFFIFVVHGQ